jgi:hypothetical protein
MRFLLLTPGDGPYGVRLHPIALPGQHDAMRLVWLLRGSEVIGLDAD